MAIRKKLVVFRLLASECLFNPTRTVIHCIIFDFSKRFQTSLLQLLLVDESFALHLKVWRPKPLLKVVAFVIIWNLGLKLLVLHRTSNSIICQNDLGRRTLQVPDTLRIRLLNVT